MTDERLRHLSFEKMHGLGNDFVIVDARRDPVHLSERLIRAMGDRHFGVGFDQLALIEDREGRTHLTFYNQDGSTSAACGNATRCIARLLMDEAGLDRITLDTDRGTLVAVDAGNGLVSVNMGPPVLDWQAIPLAREVDIDHMPLPGDPAATGMGNPHCTFFVEDAEAVDLHTIGPRTEHDPLFPERTNVQVVSRLGPDRLRARVWERGVGVTLASGSSSCAVAVAAHRRGLTGRSVTVVLDGGELRIDWREDGVWMTGPVAHVFTGSLTADFLEANQ